MFEMVQHTSLRMGSLDDCSRVPRAGRTELLIMTCVCMSVPVTMLPTERSAGVCTPSVGCLDAFFPHTPE